jgi:hypothetical protein
LPKIGDGRWNLLYKIAQNTYESAKAKIPAGGLRNQALSKASNSDYDLVWKTVSGGGGGYIVGEAETFNDLPITVGDPSIDTAYLVLEPSGVWLLNRKPAGVYIRTGDTGSLSDWTYAGILPDVFSDANFSIYNLSDSTRQVKFDTSDISTATVRTLSIPNANGTIKLDQEIRSDFIAPSSYIGIAPFGSLETEDVWTIYIIAIDAEGTPTVTVESDVAWSERV